MPGIYRSGHYLDNLSNHWLMKRWRSSKIAWIPQSWLGPQFFGDATCPRSTVVAFLDTPRWRCL